MSIGLKSKTVVLEPHQAEWEAEGKRICAEIKEILGDDAVDVQHVGSTSIRGISAKPLSVSEHLKILENMMLNLKHMESYIVRRIIRVSIYIGAEILKIRLSRTISM